MWIAFRNSGAAGYQTLINAALREYLNAKAPKFEDTLRRIIREELKSSAAWLAGASCAEGRLVRDTRKIPYTYKGEAFAIPAIRGDFCRACGESVLAAAESSRVSAAMLELNKQVNASIVDPGFIARVRKKLAPNQRQAAAIFGGGPNAFSHYENGKTKPPLALVKLLMALDRHPNLLDEVRAGR